MMGHHKSFIATALLWMQTCLVLALVSGAQAAWAGGPRFYAGSGWGTWAGSAVVWKATSLTYFTDAGPLSATVSKSQADAMVAAAAAVWNVPTSSLSLVQGGTLAEDVSDGNTTFDGQQFVFPADVQSSNESAVPIAIVYDQDGSLIDLLLGDGASEPDGCRQTAVLGDVDDVHQDDAAIHHAMLILNGRCVGSSGEQLTQMQYQLTRAFGRVLGLSWSQTNDNVFTAQTPVTGNQMAYWPVMHPLDVLCGQFSYQCMIEPFTLRTDDLNSLAQLYPVYQGAVPAGKQGTSNDALYIRGFLYFPTGQGMDWVNVTARRDHGGISEDWQVSSGITGAPYLQQVATPLSVAAMPNTASDNPGLEAFFLFRRIPLDGVSDIFFTTEPINPLYTGDSAIGPYVRPPATPSGSPAVTVDWSAQSAGDLLVTAFALASDAANATCSGNDGTEGAPASPDPSGWQAGLLCGWGHNSWFSVSAPAGHSWTLEVTATDETGAATGNKAQPVLGIWNSGDPTGTTPTVTSQPFPFNSMSLGTTQLRMDAPATDESYRVSISDQFGAGRPDFSYVARVLSLAAVAPTTVGADGGRITLTGTGFRQGNEVLVNGAATHVVSWTATEIVADVPDLGTAGATVGESLTVSVVDSETAGSAAIAGVFSYSAAPDLLVQISAPESVEAGVASLTPFAVHVLTSDGSVAVPGAFISFSTLSGTLQLSVCGGASSCTVQADASGTVQTTFTAEVPGPVTLIATELRGGAAVQLNLTAVAPLRVAAFDEADQYLAAGAGASWALHLGAQQDGAPAASLPVAWTTSASLSGQSSTGTTDASGTASLEVSATALAPGTAGTVSGCVWSTVCATWTVHSVSASEWMVQDVGTTAQQVPFTSNLSQLTMAVTDGSGHLIRGATVNLYQRVLGWEGPCDGSRCPAAPVLAASEVTVTSDAMGQVTVTPLQVPGIPQVVEVAAASGTYGFATWTLVKLPAN